MNNERIEFLKKDYVQGFPAYCGFEVKHVEYGIFESQLRIRSEHTQQDGFVHAGVIASMADHTGGYAAYTTVSDDFRILTIEFKVNYFKPAVGELIVCLSNVINKGKKIIVSESEISSVQDSCEKLVAKAMVTMMAVPVHEIT